MAQFIFDIVKNSMSDRKSSAEDYLLTVDKKFLKAAAKLNTNVKIINPLDFSLGGVT